MENFEMNEELVLENKLQVYKDLLDSSYDTFKHLEIISNYVKPFKGITWLER